MKTGHRWIILQSAKKCQKTLYNFSEVKYNAFIDKPDKRELRKGVLNMKKGLALVLALLTVLTLGLTGCGNKDTEKTDAEYVKEKGKLITCDPNLRKPLWQDLAVAKKQLLWAISQADVVKISDEEVDFLFGMDAKKGAQHILKTCGVKLVFVTCGADGCYAANENTAVFVPALSDIKVIDTTGAGDIFGGSAVFKLLQSDTVPAALTAEQLRDIVTFACTAAGLSTTKSGGISAVPTYEEVCKRL